MKQIDPIQPEEIQPLTEVTSMAKSMDCPDKVTIHFDMAKRCYDKGDVLFARGSFLKGTKALKEWAGKL